MKKIVLLSTLLAAFGTFVASAQTAPAPAPAPVPAPAAAVVEKKAPVAVNAANTGDVVTGKAAWYGKKFNGRKTASGQRYNAAALTAASNTLPFGTLVRVTNMKNKKSVVVRINDRGPSQPDRIIDLSRAAAAKIGMLRSGVAEVEVKVIGMSKGKKAKRAKAA
ncbi:MAG: septal ring lytic transglycosylase RlpA family protein [Casimicrobium sp.]